MRGTTTKTPERVAEAKHLYDNGLSYPAIAERFGVCRQTIFAWLNDPDGARLRARKDALTGACVVCGARTSGSDGKREEPRCVRCSAIKNGQNRKRWTRAAIIQAMQDWANRYGEPPAGADWNSTQARYELRDESRAVRYECESAAGRCPHVSSVVRAFGSWNAALAEAGFEPRAPHGGHGNAQRRRTASTTKLAQHIR